MYIHYIVFFVTVLLAKAVEKSGKPVTVQINGEEETENRAAFIACIVAYMPAIIFIGLRDSIGDTVGYIDNFEHLNPQGVFANLGDRNPGYDVFQNFINLYITKDPNMFLLLLAFVSVLFMIRAQSMYSPMFALSVFIFFGSTEVCYALNGARQFLAMAIMFYAFRYMESGKLIKYAIWSAIAFSIHLTSIIVIPAYFIARGKFLNFRIILTGLGAIGATAFSALFIDRLNELFISESVYSQYYQNLVETEGVNIFRVLVAAVPFILCIIYKKRIDELDDKVLNCSANMSALALAVSIFSAASGGELLGRLAEYYLIFNTLTYPLLLKRVVSKNVTKILTVGLMIGYFFFFFYQFTVVWDLGYTSSTLGISIGMEGV